ncbi:MAG: 3-keto-disaccharide hydrolase [Verrucomicrobiales bacterium]
MNRTLFISWALLLAHPLLIAADKEGFAAVFSKDGKPEGFRVGDWADVSRPAPEGADWTVKDGTLTGTGSRGSWLMSEKEFGDFILEYEFKLGPQGNSGCALRAPMKGDPAFDGLEMQMADVRYNPQAKESELTAGFYRAAAPSKQVYKPEQWNKVRIELRGAKVKVTLNGEVVQDIDLDKFTQPVPRHDGSPAPSLKDRPRKGHIGFQNLTRGNDPVHIRGARIKVFE